MRFIKLRRLFILLLIGLLIVVVINYLNQKKRIKVETLTGGKIVFTNFLDNSLWVINDDSTGLTPLHIAVSSGSPPALSPDTTEVAFEDKSKVKIKNLLTDDSKNFINDAGHPDWSPDGTKIIYCNMADGGIWLINHDGTNPQKLIGDNTAELCDPEWSPDGTKIVFKATLVNGNPEAKTSIFVIDINSDGSNPRNKRQLTNLAWQWSDHDPSWSPDSKDIVFVRYEGIGKWIEHTDSNWSIFKVDLNSNETRLTSFSDPNNPYLNGLPIFSPDGLEIMFFTNRSPIGSCPVPIYRMKTDGLNQRPFWNSNPPCSIFFDWRK